MKTDTQPAQPDPAQRQCDTCRHYHDLWCEDYSESVCPEQDACDSWEAAEPRGALDNPANR